MSSRLGGDQIGADGAHPGDVRDPTRAGDAEEAVSGELRSTRKARLASEQLTAAVVDESPAVVDESPAVKDQADEPRPRRRALLAWGATGIAGALGAWALASRPPEESEAAAGTGPVRPRGGESRKASFDGTEGAESGSPTPTPTPTPVSPGRHPFDRDRSLVEAGPRTPASRVDLPFESAPVDGTGPHPADGVQLPVADTRAARLHLLNRIGIGAGKTVLAEMEELGLAGWLSVQLDPVNLEDAGESKARSWFPLGSMDIATTRRSIPEFSWDAMGQVRDLYLARFLFSRRQVFTVVADVFHNLLHVTVPSERVWDSAGDFVENVIRHHAYGRYADMLRDAMRHPAMLRFFDNASSRRGAVNENLGRELLELHSVGTGAGYSEDEVVASAGMLTGRTIDGHGAFAFVPDDHSTDAVEVLGFSESRHGAQSGLEVGDRYVEYLARHPSTARMIASKLAVRFVSDDPTPELLDALAEVYTRNDTSILAVVVAIFESREFWSSLGTKIRRPLEDVASTVRSLGLPMDDVAPSAIGGLGWVLGAMGHQPLRWDRPDGYPDVAAAWNSSGQMIARWNMHRALVSGKYPGLPRGESVLAELRPDADEGKEEWVQRIAETLLTTSPGESTIQGMLAFLDGLEPESRHLEEVAALAFDSPSHLIR
ncbi:MULTISPECIES: DUF1800 domain-containing protein [unclassified Microbacterium]|uniref:DUF1800 domain-containing protein n=1 Tax=unclassified Microbacterium TaxID=2609290 RepID=UPI000CFC8BD7|nr:MULTISPECIES: DUF1800 domain-containing protein [unclassified Microbacterium]PQZ53489.1 hypothetical protein CQ032_15090 [Microbacterium sp. MYb43]PQZ75092.1 hypothetical protein CQ031_14445 [Microbacterium sp. MYb40]PRB19386.1 hypothetical protein CQ040_15740 [Microbacterium sp. MYb54]PRB24587.1 hypothetical protein CQ037_16245 [Microbacterium sp. MYb50]PRB63698.1 hypothetical protein CQ021_15850 [Microbacterium sp. MYb24]